MTLALAGECTSETDPDVRAKTRARDTLRYTWSTDLCIFLSDCIVLCCCRSFENKSSQKVYRFVVFKLREIVLNNISTLLSSPVARWCREFLNMFTVRVIFTACATNVRIIWIATCTVFGLNFCAKIRYARQRVIGIQWNCGAYFPLRMVRPEISFSFILILAFIDKLYLLTVHHYLLSLRTSDRDWPWCGRTDFRRQPINK